ncbi:protein nullo [Drosophila grimshawi]|uniref:GH12604 n=1 Tax=Drosophila grimshawi TaxID=7222 RepID=B4JK73_DROGR|nr:protein nullo [Drosophila grimshawi]EDV99975.1 GH12604 [Drosophila grimshawi]
MGSTHSTTATTATTAASTKTDNTPTDCALCCPKFVGLLAKLRRTLTHHLRPTRKRRCGFQRGCGARTALLRPMPRCSSFGSCSTLLVTPTSRPGKRSEKKPNATDNYAEWKCMFEHASGQGLLAPAAHRPHDISEALSGQTTPRGFPSHTDARRCPLPNVQQQGQQMEEQPLYDYMGDSKKSRRRLSFRLPSGSSSNQGSVRRLSARQRAAQARLEEQLQRELRDLEEYYGGFHYARRNERRI